MAADDTFAGLSLDSITVDDAGRVVVTDPEVAERLRSAGVLANRRNTNNGCNNVRGCGDGQNIGCTIKA